MKNAIIILLLALVSSGFIPDPLFAKITINTGVILAIGLLVKELRKRDKKDV